MADKLGLDNEIKELKLGSSFSDGRPFHTIRYDFKPANLDPQKMGSLEIKNNDEVTVTLQHVDGAGNSRIIFGDCQKSYEEEWTEVYDGDEDVQIIQYIGHSIPGAKMRKESSQKISQSIDSVRLSEMLSYTNNTFSAKNDKSQRKKNSTLKTPQYTTSKTGAIPKHIPLKVRISNPECGPQKTLPPNPTTPPHSSTSSELSLSGTDKISKTLPSGRKPSARKHTRFQRTKTPALKTTQDKSRNKINFPKTAVKSEKYTQEKNKKYASVLSLVSESSSSESPSLSESSASKSKSQVKPSSAKYRRIERKERNFPSQLYQKNLIKIRLTKLGLTFSDSDSD